MSRRENFLLALVILFGLTLLFGGAGPHSVLARDGRSDGNKQLFEELKVFSDVLSIVKEDYVETVEDKKLVEGAIRGMLTGLDPHSGYLDPDFYNDLKIQTRGEFGGLGIEITVRDGKLLVVSPMEGSPAEKAGIHAGDVIIKIEDRFTKDLTLVEAVKQLRGKRGTSVQISVHRGEAAKLLDFTVRRDVIQVQSIRHRYLGDGLGYIRIAQFVERTGSDLKAALDALRNESGLGELKGLILDLRNNPGGLLTQAVRVSDMFLRSGVIVYTESRLEGQRQRFFAHDQGTEAEYPIVVLVNGGSASASEIVSGALQDNGRAIIIGTKTFGKGSVQTITPLENGGAVTLTTALYFTKSGRSIQARGIAPDILVSLETESNQSSLRERDLPGAINSEQADDVDEEPASGSNIDFRTLREGELSLSEWLEIDLQMAKALEVLRDFETFRRPAEGTL
jgi:carboxyl-terminal processing protease